MATKLLIEKVKNHPILFDPQHEDYKNTVKKNRIWEQIGKELNLSGDNIKKKWKNTKDSYGKYLKTLTSDGFSKKNYARWQWAEYMEPLKPFMLNTKTQFCHIEVLEQNDQGDDTSDNLEVEETHQEFKLENPFAEFDDVEEQSQAMNLVETSITVPKNESRKRKLCGGEDANISTSPIGFNNSNLENGGIKRRVLDDLSPTELIFLGYAKLISNFSPKRQATAKLKIAQIIMEQEIQHGEETSQNNHTNHWQETTNSDNWGLRKDQ